MSIANPLHKADLAAVEELTEVRTGWVGRDGGGRGPTFKQLPPPTDQAARCFHKEGAKLGEADPQKKQLFLTCELCVCFCFNSRDPLDSFKSQGNPSQSHFPVCAPLNFEAMLQCMKASGERAEAMRSANCCFVVKWCSSILTTFFVLKETSI